MRAETCSFSLMSFSSSSAYIRLSSGGALSMLQRISHYQGSILTCGFLPHVILSLSLSSRSSAAHFLTEPAPSVTIVISEQNWITWHQGQGDTLLMQGRSRRLKNVRLTFREEPRGLTHLKGLSSPSIVSSTFCLFSAASALLLSISSFIFLFSSWQRQMC